jgi:CRISPR-associated protein Cmr1
LRDKGERCFLPVCDWKLLLTVRRCDDAEIESLLSALKLFGLVGGLGSRARKGWGCTTLLAMDGTPWQCPANADTWRAAMRSLVGGDLPSSAPFTAATEGSRWNAGTIHPDAAAAQQWLGQRYRDSVKATEPKAARAQFGLPREFKKGTQPRRERRASPLFLHVHSCGGGKALPCALWLPAAFLENSPAIPGNGDAGRRFVETLDSTTAGQM